MSAVRMPKSLMICPKCGSRNVEMKYKSLADKMIEKVIGKPLPPQISVELMGEPYSSLPIFIVCKDCGETSVAPQI